MANTISKIDFTSQIQLLNCWQLWGAIVSVHNFNRKCKAKWPRPSLMSGFLLS